MFSTLTEPELKIIEAAKVIFEKKGYDGARMQEIADEAKISKASLHYYFRSKEKLFDLIFEENMREFLPLISTWEDDESKGWEIKLKNFITNFVEFLRKKSMLFILREINRNPELLLKRKKNKKNLFLTYFEKLQQQPDVRQIDGKVIYVFMHSLCAYPFVNETLFKTKMQLNQNEYNTFLDTYPEHVADILISYLKKK
jgi:TetR/AcrR family transcriptional regulator